MSQAQRTRVRIGAVGLGIVLLSAVTTIVEFPYDTDPETDLAAQSEVNRFYDEAYKPLEPTVFDTAPGDEDDVYVETARGAAVAARVPETVRSFVETYGLRNKRVLEVGSGSGLLQDLAEDYTGLDISDSARRFYHKPFVVASATAIPFPDGRFDAIWSIWVLEHIPNAELALYEMRRVVKDGGHIFLWPAWECPTWLADGYMVRPYSDFDLKGKLTKASAILRGTRAYRLLYRRQVQAIRALSVRVTGGPSRLHYVRLRPNYSQYWQPDSDAAVSLSFPEVKLWFESRGDTCVNCPSELEMLAWTAAPDQMIVQVHKR